MMKMVDSGDNDDKVLAVPDKDPTYGNVTDIADLPPHKLRAIGHFFAIYKQLEGKTTEVMGWEGAKSAKKAIVHAMKLYTDKFG